MNGPYEDAPSASFDWSQDTATALEVGFEGSAGAFSPHWWNWTFGDGSFSNGTDQSPTHVYGSTGTFSVTLNASTQDGSTSATTTETVNVTTIGDAKQITQLGVFLNTIRTSYQDSYRVWVVSGVSTENKLWALNQQASGLVRTVSVCDEANRELYQLGGGGEQLAVTQNPLEYVYVPCNVTDQKGWSIQQFSQESGTLTEPESQASTAARSLVGPMDARTRQRVGTSFNFDDFVIQDGTLYDFVHNLQSSMELEADDVDVDNAPGVNRNFTRICLVDHDDGDDGGTVDAPLQCYWFKYDSENKDLDEQGAVQRSDLGGTEVEVFDNATWVYNDSTAQIHRLDGFLTTKATTPGQTSPSSGLAGMRISKGGQFLAVYNLDNSTLEVYNATSLDRVGVSQAQTLDFDIKSIDVGPDPSRVYGINRTHVFRWNVSQALTSGNISETTTEDTTETESEQEQQATTQPQNPAPSSVLQFPDLADALGVSQDSMNWFIAALVMLLFTVIGLFVGNKAGSPGLGGTGGLTSGFAITWGFGWLPLWFPMLVFVVAVVIGITKILGASQPGGA